MVIKLRNKMRLSNIEFLISNFIYSTADRKNFYYYARGSFEETKAWLRKALRRGLVTESRSEKYKTIIDELGPKLNAFIKKTKTYGNKAQK